MMSSYIKFLIQGQTLCMCCLSRNVKLIRLEACIHQKILTEIIDCKFLNINKMLVCYICHNILKTIEKFKKQCKEAFKHLSSHNISTEPEITKYIDLRINKRHQTNSLNIKTENDFESIDNIDPNLATNNLDIDIPSFIEIEIKKENNMDYQKDDTSTIDNLDGQTTSLNVTIDKIEHIDVPTMSQTQNIDKTKPKRIKNIKQKQSTDNIKTKTIDKTIKERKTRYDKYGNILKSVKLSEKEMLDEREIALKKLLALKPVHKCENCIISFKHETFLNIHNEQKHDEKNGPFQCKICKIRLKTKTRCRVHEYWHHKRFACPYCEKLSPNFYTIVRHIEKHHRDAIETKMYKCEKCDFSTIEYKKYTYHLQTHEEKICDLCNHKFVTKHGLTNHILQMHSGNRISYNCDKCDKSYKTRLGLTSHTKITHGEHEFHYCAPCGVTFKSDFILKHHLRTNRNHVQDADKIYQCSMCDKKFVEKNRLTSHMNRKHEKKKYECDICKKCFMTKFLLVRHMKSVHLKEEQPRDKICQFCGKGFTTNVILRTHITTHTKERPWKCNMCEADFRQRAALYTHCKLVHKVPYKKENK